MRVAKITNKRGETRFFEVLSVGTVQFSAKSGWVLLGLPIGGIKRELVWMHPDEVRFEWVRHFLGADSTASPANSQ